MADFNVLQGVVVLTEGAGYNLQTTIGLALGALKWEMHYSLDDPWRGQFPSRFVLISLLVQSRLICPLHAVRLLF